MTAVRMGTFGFQKQLAAGMVGLQNKAATSQLQLHTGKKYQTYSDMGSDLRPTLSARSVMANEKAYGAVGQRVGQVLDRYDAGLSALYDQVRQLQTLVSNGAATGEMHGLQSELEATFSVLSQTVNVSQGGEYLMSGLSVNVRPFTPSSLAGLTALPTTDDAFVGSDTPLSARVTEGNDMAYGLKARDIGKPVADMLVEIDNLGPIDGSLTDAQKSQLITIASRVKALGDSIAEQQASNGHRQAQVTNLAEQSVERENQLKKFIVETEDVDPTEVLTRMANEKLALEASYQAFSAFRDMSLSNYLR